MIYMGLSLLRVRCIGVSGEYYDLASTARHTAKPEGIKKCCLVHAVRTPMLQFESVLCVT